LDRKEATTVQEEIVRNCNGITEKNILLVLSIAESAMSHGYQIHIKSSSIEVNLPCLKEICQRHNLALDNSKNDFAVVYRPCFIHYAGRTETSV